MGPAVNECGTPLGESVLLGEWFRERSQRGKAPVRAKVEHPFLKAKRMFGYPRVRYRGQEKNTRRRLGLGKPADGGEPPGGHRVAVGPNPSQEPVRIPDTPMRAISEGQTSPEAGREPAISATLSPANTPHGLGRGCSAYPQLTPERWVAGCNQFPSLGGSSVPRIA